MKLYSPLLTALAIANISMGMPVAESEIPIPSSLNSMPDISNYEADGVKLAENSHHINYATLDSRVDEAAAEAKIPENSRHIAYSARAVDETDEVEGAGYNQNYVLPPKTAEGSHHTRYTARAVDKAEDKVEGAGYNRDYSPPKVIL
ncbi:MAG: hypothetical protein Q9202_006458 [Teloschistes flavicans]